MGDFSICFLEHLTGHPTYQRTLTPLNKQIRELEFRVSTKKYELINKYLSEGISYDTIESYMNKKNNI